MKSLSKVPGYAMLLLLLFYFGSARAEPAADFQLFDQAGNPISLQDYRGKALILHFWGTWCPFCHELQPKLDRLYRKYKNSGLEVLAISIREQRAANPQQVLAELGVSFPTAVKGDNVAKMYGVPGTPTTFFINREAQILWKTHSAKASDSQLELQARRILNLDK
ncbi:hypothetical protein A9R01_01070 ['Osedax' symbiont bacterium Rs2_46_30_T18]|nr:hypothetical protein A9R01_01070 ['Osedax' symbiont bacterium Rs2_46_30_T18]